MGLGVTDRVFIGKNQSARSPLNINSTVFGTQWLVAWSGVMRTEGIHAEGEVENPSNSSGVWRKTPRLVVRVGSFV
jgi:hypothetical protein